jgi:hypothetical protein
VLVELEEQWLLGYEKCLSQYALHMSILDAALPLIPLHMGELLLLEHIAAWNRSPVLTTQSLMRMHEPVARP